jgi:hypothetical protein
MARPSRSNPLPPSRQPIERIRCSHCDRTWAVYEGRYPRMWTVLPDAVFCDRRPCNAALEESRAAAKRSEKPSTAARPGPSQRETKAAKVSNGS